MHRRLRGMPQNSLPRLPKTAAHKHSWWSRWPSATEWILLACGLCFPAMSRECPTTQRSHINLLKLFSAATSLRVITFARKLFPTGAVSVPVHALRCGPEISVTSPLRWRWFELRGVRTHIFSRRGRGNVGIPKGFPKSVGRVGSRLHGFPCFPYSVISMACCSPGRCWIQSYIKRRNAPYSPEMFVVIGFR
jgi:hypothetical protein